MHAPGPPPSKRDRAHYNSATWASTVPTPTSCSTQVGATANVPAKTPVAVTQSWPTLLDAFAYDRVSANQTDLLGICHCFIAHSLLQLCSECCLLLLPTCHFAFVVGQNCSIHLCKVSVLQHRRDLTHVKCYGQKKEQ
jgi:hypothetical protein